MADLNREVAELAARIQENFEELGATQKNLNTNYIGRQTLTLPNSELLLGTFSDVVEPLFEQMFTLAQSVTSLTKARDLLLPRLMNGDIAV